MRLVIPILISVVLAGTGAVAFIYQPVEPGGHGGTPGIDVPYTDSDDSVGRVIEYVHGAKMALRFSVRNHGPWGVTITSVSDQDEGLFEITEVRMGFADRRRCCVDTQPFRPYALHPGEDRIIELHGRLAGCGSYVSGTTLTWDSFEVGYRFMGIPRHATIPALHPVSITVPEGYVCPEVRTPGS